MQEIPQVVVSLGRVCCTHVEPSRSVATTQPRIRCQEIPEVQFVERMQEQIVETIKVLSQEHATQRTSEQIEVQMNTNSRLTSEQTEHIPILGKRQDMSVQLSTHAINECMHSLKISKENVAKSEEVTLSFRSRSQGFTKSTGSRHTARQAEKEVYLVVVQ